MFNVPRLGSEGNPTFDGQFPMVSCRYSLNQYMETSLRDESIVVKLTIYGGLVVGFTMLSI